MTQNERSRPVVSEAANNSTSMVAPTELEVQAAARILARHHHPEWRPSNDDIDSYGHGYGDGVRQRIREVQADV